MGIAITTGAELACRPRALIARSCSRFDNEPMHAKIDGFPGTFVPRIVEATTERQIASAAALIREYVASLGVDLSFEKFEEEMAEFPSAYSRPDGRILIAMEGKAAVGVVGVRRLSGDACELKRMYVQPGFRGRGIGRMLATRAIDEARGIGYSRMRLDSLSRLKEAIALYESLGFRTIEQYRVNPHKDAVFMELDLGKPRQPASKTSK